MDNETTIYGRNPVLEALQKGLKIEKVYLVDGLKGDFELKIRTLCEDNGIPLSRLPHKKLDALTKGGNHQGVMAEMSPIEYLNIDELLETLKNKENCCIVMLDGVTDVRNMGAIARSAQVFGADAIIVPSQGSAKINSHAIKTSAGALLQLPLCRVNSLLIAMETLQNNDYQIFASDIKSDNILSSIDLRGNVCVVLGSEDKGVSKKTLQVSDSTFKIAQASNFDSLNVSVAAGVILYEVFKQRS